jgi:hypothetical protein
VAHRRIVHPHLGRQRQVHHKLAAMEWGALPLRSVQLQLLC